MGRLIDGEDSRDCKRNRENSYATMLWILRKIAPVLFVESTKLPILYILGLFVYLRSV